jgi:hypothetical protein
MPLLDGLFRKAGGGPVVIPVLARVPVAFRVYYTPGYPPMAPEDLRAKAGAWLDEHAEEPLRSALKPVLQSDRLVYTDMPKTSFPPPLDILQKADVGPEERARFDAAWQVAVITCESMVQVPMLGLWAAIAAGRSAALGLKGSLFDAVAVRLTSIASYEQELSGRGVVRAGEHIAVGSSRPGGVFRWHTTGMTKFGLPDLEVLESPAGVDLVAVLEAVAQQLIDGLLTANHGRAEPLPEVSLSPELSLAVPGGPPAVRLFYSAGQGQVTPAIEVLLPRA